MGKEAARGQRVSRASALETQSGSGIVIYPIQIGFMGGSENSSLGASGNLGTRNPGILRKSVRARHALASIQSMVLLHKVCASVSFNPRPPSRLDTSG